MPPRKTQINDSNSCSDLVSQLRYTTHSDTCTKTVLEMFIKVNFEKGTIKFVLHWKENATRSVYIRGICMFVFFAMLPTMNVFKAWQFHNALWLCIFLPVFSCQGVYWNLFKFQEIKKLYLVFVCLSTSFSYLKCHKRKL